MNPGDLVIVLFETRRYYLVIGEMGHSFPGETRYKLLDDKGATTIAFRSEIKLVRAVGA